MSDKEYDWEGPVFYVCPVQDDIGKYWVLFKEYEFHTPTAIIPDDEMVKIANQVLGRTLDGRPEMPDLKGLRKETGLTLKEVSAATGVSVSYLSDLERGSRGVYTVTEKVRGIIDFYNDFQGKDDRFRNG